MRLVRKTLILNRKELTFRKKDLLNTIIKEYLRVLNFTCLQLPVCYSSSELHQKTYKSIRETSFLPSDVIQEARKDIWKLKKVVNKKTLKDKSRINLNNCSIRLNKRWFKFILTNKGYPCFKLTYRPKKTFVIPIKIDNQFKRFTDYTKDEWKFDNISLLKNGNIAVVLEKEFEEPKITQTNILGVDVGSATLAAVTILNSKTGKVKKQLYFGRDVAIKQKKFDKRRSKLKSLADKGSNQAKKSLKRLKHKQRNFVKTRSGQVAKEIVNLAKEYNCSVAVEKLKNLRGIKTKKGQKGNSNKKGRKKINRIPYHQFNQFLETNCSISEIPYNLYDPYHTSKFCSNCGAINSGHLSTNYSLYKCRKCGRICNSDRNASKNVAIKSLLERNLQVATLRPSFLRDEVFVNNLLRP
ncbi:MAG: hypothetical protein DRP06_01715, partial [Candidatus Aenigmatarchaeota archaeon]